MTDKKKKFSLGLLPKVIIAIALGILCSLFFPDWAAKAIATFNSLFSNFLGFIIPLLILGLVAPGIAEMGKGAGKLLLLKVEDMAAAEGKAFVRLDCSAANETLNCYYDDLGFLVAGVVNSGFYVGYLREKRVHIPAPSSPFSEGSL